MTSLRYGRWDVCSYNDDVNTAYCTHFDGMGYLRYGQGDVYFYIVDVNTDSCARCVGMTFLRYGQGDVCFCNVAWIMFPVYIVMLWVFSSMGNEMFLYIYNVSVNTVFFTHCDNMTYGQWNVSFYNVDLHTASCTHFPGMVYVGYGQGYIRFYNVDVKTVPCARCVSKASLR